MAFEGYLIKAGSYDTFFNKYIVAKSYNITKKVIDVDSYRDANGILHRNALSHLSYVVSFDLREMDNVEMEQVISVLREQMELTGIPIERKLILTFYVPEMNDYVTADVYIPDIEFKINRIDTAGIIPYIEYDKTTLKFIAY